MIEMYTLVICNGCGKRASEYTTTTIYNNPKGTYIDPHILNEKHNNVTGGYRIMCPKGWDITSGGYALCPTCLERRELYNH